MKKLYLVLGSVFVLGSFSIPVMADDDDDNNKGECISAPAIPGYTSLDDEFGPGTAAKTRCLKKDKVKLVLQINKACRDTAIITDGITGAPVIENHARSCKAGDPANRYSYGRGYGIAQTKAMINDYTITNGIDKDKLDIILIVHGGGGTMLMNNKKPFAKNNLQADVEYLLSQGVEIKFCMNTVRGMAKKISAKTGLPITSKALVQNFIIDGVTYVTGGMTALQDYQDVGYTYVQP